ncbi:hypothetical protein [Pseudolactococcus yaeyamensis]
MLDVVMILYLIKLSIINAVFIPIGFCLYSLILKCLSSFNVKNKMIKEFLNYLPIDAEKEIKLFLNGIYFQVFASIYLVAFFINANSVEITLFIILIVSFAYQDTFVLNCIGIEQQELKFLRKEGFLTLSYLKRKVNFWFTIGFILYLILILEKNMLLNQMDFLVIINLILFYILNFLGVLYLAFKKVEYKISYYKVKISSLYLELIFCLSYLILFYIIGELIILMTIFFIFYLYRKISKLLDKEFNFEDNHE